MQALESAYAPIAQLDRVTDYESVGRGFESLSAYHLKSPESQDSGLFSYFQGYFEKAHFSFGAILAHNFMKSALAAVFRLPLFGLHLSQIHSKRIRMAS